MTSENETTSAAVSDAPDFVWELFTREDLEEGIVKMEEAIANVQRALETQAGPIIRRRQPRVEDGDSEFFSWEISVGYTQAQNRRLLEAHGLNPDAPEWADCV